MALNLAIYCLLAVMFNVALVFFGPLILMACKNAGLGYRFPSDGARDLAPTARSPAEAFATDESSSLREPSSNRTRTVGDSGVAANGATSKGITPERTAELEVEATPARPDSRDFTNGIRRIEENLRYQRFATERTPVEHCGRELLSLLQTAIGEWMAAWELLNSLGSDESAGETGNLEQLISQAESTIGNLRTIIVHEDPATIVEKIGLEISRINEAHSAAFPS